MLDIRFVRENPDAVKENIRKKFQDAKLPLVDEVIALDAEYRAAIGEASDLRANRNKLSKQIGALMGQAKKDPSKLAEAEAVKKQVTDEAERLAALEKLEAGASEVPPRPRYDCLLLGMTYPREELCRRIDERLQARLDAGMVEEVAALRAGGADDSFLEGLGLEYRYILRYLTGEIPTLDGLKDELGRAIKRFAKRQMVWFQKDRDVLWLDMEVDFLTQAVRAVEDFLA